MNYIIAIIVRFYKGYPLNYTNLQPLWAFDNCSKFNKPFKVTGKLPVTLTFNIQFI